MTKSLSVGSEVIARCDHQTTSSEQLSFFKGDILTIVGESADTNDSEWFKAKDCDGKEGLVPAVHLQKRIEVKLNPMPWFHGKISRDEAERLLHPPKVSLSTLNFLASVEVMIIAFEVVTNLSFNLCSN